MPLKEQDKTAWGWAELTDPNGITHYHVLTAYRTKPEQKLCKSRSCRRNCRGNPFCLSGLGESRLRENSIPEDTSSELQRRNEGSFVGLKNLGATCYVNSLLQLWFHNKKFRDAIYLWNPHEDPKEKGNLSLSSDGPFNPQSPMGHLQQLFALMLQSKQRYIDPSALVESLRLEKGTQQDAQEFSKLFIALIEDTLKHQSLTILKNFVRDNFRGEYTYVTRCCSCQTDSVNPSMFYELELNIRGNSTLEQSLTEFLKEEKLEGANCYSCTVCQSKQEASRFIELCSLPPILNLQLMRFVYDREKGQKKKLKHVVQFPETLDMTSFVQRGSGDSLIYNLSAVLIHRGSGASSGHFIAYIKDGESGTWSMFNDETVLKLEGKKLEIDEDNSENAKPNKTPSLPKGVQSSTDAYMLVYTSEGHNSRSQEVNFSKEIQLYVDTQNENFEHYCEEIMDGKKLNFEKQQQLLNEYETVIGSDASELDDLSDIEVVSTDWLSSWLESKTNITQQIDNTKLVCPHGFLDPLAVTNAKYVSATAADLLYNKYGGGPRMKLSVSLCETCVRNRCLSVRTSAQTQEESKLISNLMKKRMGVNEPGYYVHKYCLKTWRSQVMNIIEGKNSFNKKCALNENSYEPASEDPPSQAQVETEIKEDKTENIDKSEGNDQMECNVKTQYDRLRKTVARKRRNSTIPVPLSDLRDCFVRCKKLQIGLNKPEESNSRNFSLLSQCKQLSVKLRRLSCFPRQATMIKQIRSLRKQQIRKRIESAMVCEHNDNKVGENVQNNNSSEHNDNEVGENVLSTNCGGGWPCNGIDEVEKLDDKGNKSDDGMDFSRGFNEEIKCMHGNLSVEENERKLVPVRVWEILRKYFPSAPSFPSDSEPCLQCQNVASKSEILKQQLCEAAQVQKRDLSDLFHLRNRPIPGKTEESIYILHKEHFYQPWCAFIKSGTRRDVTTVVDPPISLNMALLLCEHSLLHYSPQYEDDLNRIVLATKQEWETLISFYIADMEVTLSPDQYTTPDLCEECFAARLENEQKEKLSYSRAKLNIRLVPSATTMAALASSEEQESSESGSQNKRVRLDDSWSPNPPGSKKGVKSATTTSSNNGPSLPADAVVRRSARHRKVPGQKDFQLTVSSSLTLRDVKQMITGHFAAAPFDQHLSTMEGKELQGDFNTLFSFGILPNTTLLLQIDEPKDSFDDAIEESMGAFTEPEAGFKGTGLLQNY